jgi:uracil-DNA glycosylase family 4
MGQESNSHMPSTFKRRQASPFPFHPKRVPGMGPRPARCMIIGERPGMDEARVGRPFVGPSGHVLDTYLSAAAVDRSQVYVTNCVKNFTDYGKPTAAELERDKPELIQEILLCEPEIIGLVGAYAVTHVLGWEKSDMDRRHGIPMRVQSLFGGGEVTGGDNGWIVIPLYHPAQVIHAPEMSPTVLDDYLRLGMLLDGEIEPVADDIPEEQLDYRVVTAADLDAVLPAICDLVGIDTEGTSPVDAGGKRRWKPWSLQFSFRAGQSFFIHGNDSEALAKFDDWLRRVQPFVSLQNALHDLPVLRAMGIELPDGSYCDTMIHAYQLCVEPQGLKPLAYRHAGMMQDSYDDVIGDVGWSIAMEYLCQVAVGAWPDPEPEIIKDGIGSRVKKPQGVNKLVNRILADIASGKTLKDGAEVDPRERWKKLTPQAKAPVIAAMGDMRTPDLDDVPFERASRYAIRDADCQYRITELLEAKIKTMELEKASAIDHAILPMIDRMMEVGIQLAPSKFWSDIGDQCDKQMAKAVYNIYKFSGREINPGSGDQVAEYLYGNKDSGGLGLRPSRMTDTGARGSVDAVSLEGLLSQSPVIQDFMDYTEAQKIKGTYVEPLKELCQIGDGRTHTTIRTTRTTTGRLSCADPPLHQIPIMTDLGKQLRGGFVAPEGRCIASYDFSQLEMRVCAHDSRDELLLKLFWEDRDIHTETACKIFSVSQGNLSRDSRGKVNDSRRTAAKHAAFSLINGVTEHGLVNYLILNRCKRPDGQPWTLDDCVMLMAEWFNIYYGVKRFQKACIEETRATGIARETIGGRIIYLPQIWSQHKTTRETAERMSYVMHTQGGGASLVKLAMGEVWRQLCRDRNLKVDALLQVHDELLFELPDRDEDKALVDVTVKHIFNNTTKLRVAVECAGGTAQNWLEAH